MASETVIRPICAIISITDFWFSSVANITERKLLRVYRPVTFVTQSLNIKSIGMYRCSVELSVQYDGQSQSESEHASLIDEHDSFNSVAKQIRFVF